MAGAFGSNLGPDWLTETHWQTRVGNASEIAIECPPRINPTSSAYQDKAVERSGKHTHLVFSSVAESRVTGMTRLRAK